MYSQFIIFYFNISLHILSKQQTYYVSENLKIIIFQ